MLAQLTSRQLTELEAFWQHERGWGDMKRDYHFGQLCAIIAEPNRDKKKRPRPFTTEDFAMRPREIKPLRSDKAMRAAFDALCRVKVKKKTPRKKKRHG